MPNVVDLEHLPSTVDCAQIDLIIAVSEQGYVVSPPDNPRYSPDEEGIFFRVRLQE